MATTTTKRRDRSGRFVRTCIGGTALGYECETLAQYGIDGWGFLGLANFTQPRFCLRHARQALRRYKAVPKGYPVRDSYRIVKFGPDGFATKEKVR